MIIERLLKKRNMTKYRLATDAGIPHATLNDICSGKTKLENAPPKRCISWQSRLVCQWRC